MPFVKEYTSSNEKSLDNVLWPSTKKSCATITVDYSVPCRSSYIDNNCIDEALALYGDTVNGEWLLPLFEQYRIKATLVVIPTMVERYSSILKKFIDAGHEIAIGGENKKDISKLSFTDEEQSIANTTQYINSSLNIKASGWFSLPRTGDKYPGGFLTENTFDILKKYGYQYFGNGMADDIPYYTSFDKEGDASMLTLPYHYLFDSQFFLFFPGVGFGSGLINFRNLNSNWQHQLEGSILYARQFNINIMPCLNYWGAAQKGLKNTLQNIHKNKDIWQVTSKNLAEWWKSEYPISNFFPTN